MCPDLQRGRVQLRRAEVRLILLFALLTGCTPTCKQVCDHLVECGNSGMELVNSEECQESCLRQDALYEGWNDESLRDGFDAALVCIDESSCTALEQGSCYDPEIWPY